MKTKTVFVSSVFPASVDEIWNRLQRLETLQHIANPYAKFTLVDGTETVWKEGQTFKFSLRLFGFIPMGIHTITIIRFDKQALTIYTNEYNKSVPVWNHKIMIQKIDQHHNMYTDEVELHAGWKTPIVVLWSKLFYKHRQKKWIKLLQTA